MIRTDSVALVSGVCPLCPKHCGTKISLRHHVIRFHMETAGLRFHQTAKTSGKIMDQIHNCAAAALLTGNANKPAANNLHRAATLIRASVTTSPSWSERQEQFNRRCYWDREIALVLDRVSEEPLAGMFLLRTQQQLDHTGSVNSGALMLF